MDQAVERSLRQVASSEILSRFRRRAANEISWKNSGDPVTEADLAAEQALADELQRLLPQALVVGEESSHRDRTLLQRATQHEFVWIIDPLDGTSFFARGEGPFGIIVALLRNGRTEAGWIHLPLVGRTAYARRDHGVWLDGARVQFGPGPAVEHMRGAVFTRFFPAAMKAVIETRSQSVHDDRIPNCAAARYVSLLAGEEHFALFSRTMPWDHAAGILMIEQAGGAGLRFDETPYLPTDCERGVLVCSDRRRWRALRDLLIPTAG